MTADQILQKHEDANEMHFHQVDREFIIQAMKEYATSSQTEISDEEIEKAAKEWYDKKGIVNYKAEIRAWVSACKWYKQQLKKKNL